MIDWKLLAIITPIFFVSYQTLTKFLPKDLSPFLVNFYAALVGAACMLILHVCFSGNSSLSLPTKVVPIVLGIGALIALGNLGIIKAYSLGAPQSLFTPIFYVALILYGILFGWLVWHERLHPMQILGIGIAVGGLLLSVYFKK